jgi:hypothetical protein
MSATARAVKSELPGKGWMRHEEKRLESIASSLHLMLPPQISATRSIIGAAIGPLNLTGEHTRRISRISEARLARRGGLSCAEWVNSDCLAVSYVGSLPNLLIV